LNLPEIGGLQNLVTHPEVSEKLNILPTLEQLKNPELLVPLFILPFAVQWWSTWYPGSEPGGGGYIAQRMLAAKNERHATFATLFFNFAHYALRPWPWILVGLASMIVFPSLDSIRIAYPEMQESMVGHDLGYSLMIKYLPAGLLGIVLTSLAAAFMSTISTQLNWGSSYIVNDFYVRFLHPEASQKRMVWVGRVSTVVLMVIAAGLSFFLNNAKDFFDLMLLIGAGTGLLFILRWFWKRINPYSEIAAMIVSFLIAVIFFILNKNIPDFNTTFPSHYQLISSVFITTLAWVLTTLLTHPEKQPVLENFEQKAFGSSNGMTHKYDNFAMRIIGFFAIVLGIYSALLGTGYLLFRDYTAFGITGFIFLICAVFLITMRNKIFKG
jgi:Na+/proline symporter